MLFLHLFDSVSDVNVRRDVAGFLGRRSGGIVEIWVFVPICHVFVDSLNFLAKLVGEDSEWEVNFLIASDGAVEFQGLDEVIILFLVVLE